MIFEKDIAVTESRLDYNTTLTFSHVPTPVCGGEKDLPISIMNESPIGKAPGTPREKKPTILWVMGGAWLECPRDKVVPSLMTYFAHRGYTVAACEYRVSREAIWPAQIQDVQTAIRYLRANADSFGIDENRIAIMGLSAGGHLAAMAGMNPEGYTSEEYKEFSSQVIAAVDMFGPTEMESIGVGAYVPEGAPAPAHPGPSPEEMLVGGPLAEHKEQCFDANPINHISEKAAPMLLMHGDHDPMVSKLQSVKLHDALNAAGHPTDLYLIKGATHGGHEFFQDECKEIILNFLDKIMKSE